MKRFRMFLQHSFNPLHVYCRLAGWGMAKSSARRLCSVYERFVYGLMV